MKILQKIHLWMMWWNWKAGFFFKEYFKSRYRDLKEDYSQTTGEKN